MDWDILKTKARQIKKEAGKHIDSLAEQANKHMEQITNVTSTAHLQQNICRETGKLRQLAEESPRIFSERAHNLLSAATKQTGQIWNSENTVQFRQKIQQRTEELSRWAETNSRILTEQTRDMVSVTSEQVEQMWNSERSVRLRGASQKAMRVISGIHAVEERRKSIHTRDEADRLKKEIEDTNEVLRDDLNEQLESFGRFRLEALSSTVGRFIRCLEVMNRRAKGKEYEFLTSIDVSLPEIKEMERIDMKTSEAMRTLAVGGGFAAIGLAGTPVLVTAAITQVCVAGTGTAISTLSGAAASNAVLAWLGGGTLAAGGGGVAAGTVILGAITATATVGLAVIAVGTLASQFYTRKNTEAEAYLAEVQEWANRVQASWTVMVSIKKRVEELYDITERLLEKAEIHMSELEKTASRFDAQNSSHVSTFQQCAIIAKSMSELAQTPVLDNDGNLCEQSEIVAKRTEKILNTEL